MNELVKLLFNQGLVTYALVMLTFFASYLILLGGIRVIIESSLSKLLKDCITHWHVAKFGAERAHKKINDEDSK